MEGKLGDTPDGDLAVDDIRIDKGVCVKGIEGLLILNCLLYRVNKIVWVTIPNY